jgi:hypothetical protein
MEDKEKTIVKEKLKPTPAFGIALILLLIIFIIYLFNSPLTAGYGFWPLIGIGAACAFVGGIIYGFAYGIVEGIFKVLVEIIAVFVLFSNAMYLVNCWVTWDLMKLKAKELGILQNWNSDLLATLYVLLPLLIVNIFAFFIIYPLSRIAGTRVDLD